MKTEYKAAAAFQFAMARVDRLRVDSADSAHANVDAVFQLEGRCGLEASDHWLARIAAGFIRIYPAG
jgi:hypothetical protein